MSNETIFKREDGRTIKIDVSIYLPSISRFNEKATYSVGIFIREKGKRKFKPIYSGNDYQYRALSRESREAFVLGKQLEFVTAEEIQEAKLALWQLLKP